MCCDSLLPWLAVLYVNVSCVVGSLQRHYWILRWRAQAYNTAYATRRTEDKTLYFLVQPRVLGVPANLPWDGDRGSRLIRMASCSDEVDGTSNFH